MMNIDKLKQREQEVLLRMRVERAEQERLEEAETISVSEARKR